MKMGSLLKSTLNTRYISDKCKKYIRSDIPLTLSEDEKNFLLENNYKTVVDLRTDSERIRKRSAFEAFSEFKIINLPVTGGDKIPLSEDSVSESYFKMVDSQMTEIIRIMENADTGVFYFCNAGKDRTGVVSAILLKRMGFDNEYIINDYMKSAKNLEAMLEKFISEHTERDYSMIIPKERYMREFLEMISENELI